MSVPAHPTLPIGGGCFIVQPTQPGQTSTVDGDVAPIHQNPPVEAAEATPSVERYANEGPYRYGYFLDTKSNIRVKMRIIPQCKTCCHPNRIQIEQELVFHGPDAIRADPTVDTTGLSRDSIGRHRRGNHAAVSTDRLVRLMVERANSLGLSIEEFEAQQGSEFITAQMVADKFRDKLLRDPNFEPTVSEGLNAIKLIADLKRGSAASEGITPTDLFMALTQFRAHVVDTLSNMIPDEAPAILSALNRAIDRDPLLGGLGVRSPEVMATTSTPVLELDAIEEDEVDDEDVVESSPQDIPYFNL